MRSIARLLCILIVLQTESAVAAIPPCGGEAYTKLVTEPVRQVRSGQVTCRTYNNAGGTGGMRLPPIGRGQLYCEYDVDSQNVNAGNRGQKRLVYVETRAGGGPVYNPIYYTKDHYQRFCLRQN